MNSSKVCPTCGESKPIDEFGQDASKKDNLTYCCKSCLSVSGKRYAAKASKRFEQLGRAKFAECGKCGETKPAVDFAISNRTKTGLGGWCKKCACEYAAERRRKAREEKGIQ